MGNLQNGTIDWQDLAFTSDKIEIEKYSLAPGDVLFNRTNSPELVGKAAIYRGERPALFAGYLIRINHIETLVSSQYLNLFLGSHVARRHGSTVKTDGVNQSNINGEKLQSYPFPYCSLAEQCEVVRMLDEKLSLTDRLMQEIDAGLAKSAALRQSILQQAFSGQLVAQDLNDEPASVLLERIKAEKAEQNKDNKNNKRRDAA
jgi:type I restriction enzyme S subunit